VIDQLRERPHMLNKNLIRKKKGGGRAIGAGKTNPVRKLLESEQLPSP